MSKARSRPLTYGDYLRIPELLELQTPLGHPPVHDEMLFIVLQQAQELWFKQVLHDLHAVVGLMEGARLLEATHLLGRVNRILEVLREEVVVMETLAPAQFQRFRHLLTPSSGFESQQFRELELASGLRDEAFLKMLEKVVDLPALEARWPKSLHAAFYGLMTAFDLDPVWGVVQVYTAPARYPEMHALLEALSEYEMRFAAWRFHHMQVVERVIGDRSAGTGGSPGRSYLGRTLTYRFFPELWEARNLITSRAGSPYAPHPTRVEENPS